MTALVVPVLICALAICLDYMMLSNKRQVLQSSLDSASLAAVSALESKKKTTAEVRSYALNFLAAQLKGRMSDDEIFPLIASATVSATQTTLGFDKSYVVAMEANLSVSLTPFTRLAGASLTNLVVASSTTNRRASKHGLRSSCCRTPKRKAADY
jgi:Flp pilus assembly protein TadG